MAYLFLGITHAPRSVIVNKMLPEVDGLLARLDGAEYRESEAEAGGGKGKGKWKSDKDIERAYGSGKGGYWDDYCLAMFLRGVCLRYLAYPVRFLFFCSLLCCPSPRSFLTFECLGHLPRLLVFVLMFVHTTRLTLKHIEFV